MSRISRSNSKTVTKTYHVLMRGVNKENLFIDNNDRNLFLDELKKAKEEYQFHIYGYVLMSNHVHLIIYDKNNKLSEIIHKISMKYAMYFNKKYNRVGHVFQNRFKSICIDTEGYLKNLVRYIHRNPEKAGICKTEMYNWSSYKEYVYGENVANTGFILELFGNNRKKAIKQFLEFNKLEEDEYSDAEFEIEKEMNDKEAKECIERILKIDNLISIKKYNYEIRNAYIYKIYEIKGISAIQIARLLKISKTTIYKILSDNKNRAINKMCP